VSIADCPSDELSLTFPPFVRAWDGTENPLPMRVIRPAAARRAHTLLSKAPPWVYTGPTSQPFNFCKSVRRLCKDIVAHCDALRHVDISRLLFTVTQARSHRLHGLQARVTPLRFRGGALARRRWGTMYRVQRYFVGGREILYVIAFCLPRFPTRISTISSLRSSTSYTTSIQRSMGTCAATRAAIPCIRTAKATTTSRWRNWREAIYPMAPKPGSTISCDSISISSNTGMAP